MIHVRSTLKKELSLGNGKHSTLKLLRGKADSMNNILHNKLTDSRQLRAQ